MNATTKTRHVEPGTPVLCIGYSNSAADVYDYRGPREGSRANTPCLVFDLRTAGRTGVEALPDFVAPADQVTVNIKDPRISVAKDTDKNPSGQWVAETPTRVYRRRTRRDAVGAAAVALAVADWHSRSDVTA